MQGLHDALRAESDMGDRSESGRQIFVSHASADAAASMALVASLEAAGMRCWIAPRDVRDGEPFVGEIVAGIRECSMFLLVHTPNSDASSYVMRELTQAVNAKKTVLTVRAGDFAVSPAMRFYLDPVQSMLFATLDDHARADVVVRVGRLLAGQSGVNDATAIATPASPIVPTPWPTNRVVRALILAAAPVAAFATIALIARIGLMPTRQHERNEGAMTTESTMTGSTYSWPTPPGGFPDPNTCFPSRPRREDVDAYSPPRDAAACTLEYVNQADEPLRLRLYDWGLHYTSADSGDAPWQEFPFPADGPSRPYNDFVTGKGWFSCGVVDGRGEFHYLGELKVFERHWTTIIVQRDGRTWRWRVSQRD